MTTFTTYEEKIAADRAAVRACEKAIADLRTWLDEMVEEVQEDYLDDLISLTERDRECAHFTRLHKERVETEELHLLWEKARIWGQ